MNWKTDAALAGQLERGAKVHLTMLIARCVEPGKGQGRRNVSEKSEKSSAKGFADHSGISDKTVTAYLKTWDAMAADGIVPSREELMPGVDVDLPDQAKWLGYYREANRVQVDPDPSTGQGDATARGAKSEHGTKRRRAPITDAFDAALFPCEQGNILVGFLDFLDAGSFTNMRETTRRALSKIIRAELTRQPVTTIREAAAELDWDAGDWDDDKIQSSPRLSRIAEGMRENLDGIDELGNEGVMLDRIGESIIDFVTAENKVLGMARMMQAVSEFTASYRVSHR